MKDLKDLKNIKLFQDFKNTKAFEAIKKYFETPKKAVVSSLCVVAVLALLATGAVSAVSFITGRSSAIGAESAANFAFAHAGVDPAATTGLTADFEREGGRFVYDIKFISGSTAYGYTIDASDGTVIEHKSELLGGPLGNNNDNNNIDKIENSGNGENGDAVTELTLDEAKALALSDAGLKAADVTFTQVETDNDRGVKKYELEFVTAENEYEYEISAADGKILEKSVEALALTPETPESPEKTLDEAKAIALTDAGLKAADVTFTKAETDVDRGVKKYELEFATSDKEYEYEIGAADGKILEKKVENLAPAEITLDRAKTIALSDAGVSASGATFTKAELDTDDGVRKYELEFVTADREYEYDISAADGRILEKSSELIPTPVPTDSYISKDDARSIALTHANMTPSDVTFTKVELEIEGDSAEYEIEFVCGRTRYEYTLDAITGVLLEYDIKLD